jgi:membrane-bound lytic murein transglycosylase A
VTRPRAALAALVLVLLAACEAAKPPGPTLALAPAAIESLPGWTEDRVAEALPALARSCGRMAALPDDAAIGEFFGVARDWRGACAALAGVPSGDDAALRATLAQAFRAFAATESGRADGLFTGYYEAELRGSRARGGRFTTPVHARPADLVSVELGLFREPLRGQRIAGRVDNGRLLPYPTRAEILAGAIDGRAPVLVWVDDPVDLFFMHVQGSGAIALAEGGRMRLGWDGGNGQPYVAVGRVLVDRGALPLEAVSMQSIRAWLAAHPGEADALMNANPSYVFFREIAGDGPIGTQGVALTPGRSLAVDRRFVPMGVPIWLDAADPLDPAARLRRLMVAQDTGGAITGAVRGDVFWGAGPDAAERAGRMRSAGRWWVLVPAAIAARLGPGG